MQGRSLPWRVRLGRSWWRYQWPVLGVLAAIGVVLGYVGWRQERPHLSVSDALYLDLRLWIGQAPDEPSSGALDAARFLLPGVAGYSTLAAASALLRTRILATRASFAKNHIVVAGCGPTGLGFVLSARRKGRAVTVIDNLATNPLIHVCHAAGVHVIVGDATDPETLARARIDRAADLVAVCPDDDVNTTIALQAMSRPLQRKLRIAARVRDAAVGQVLRAYQLHCEDRRVRLEVFDLDQVAGPLLLDRATAVAAGRRLALFGDHPVFAHLLRELSAREDARMDGETAAFESVVVVADPAPSWLPAVEKAWGERPTLLHLELVPRLAALSPPAPIRDAAVALVASGGDGASLATALMLNEAAPEQVYVIACLSRAPDPHHAGRLPDIEIFDVISGVCTPELLDRAMIETLARAIHERYVVARGPEAAAAKDPSVAPWEELSPALQDSNRDQAAHIGTKLRAIQCGVVPLNIGADLSFAFAPGEVEALAEMEHDRWVKERRTLGWTPGPKDVAAKKTPYLVPWSELPDDVRDLDRETVTGIPELLARVGYGIVRASRPIEG